MSGLLYTDVKNPVYWDAKRQTIKCDVKFENFDSYMPYCAAASDTQTHGQALYEELISGKWGDIAPFAGNELDLSAPPETAASANVVKDE